MSETSPLLVGVGATLSGLAVVLALLAVLYQPLLAVVALALGAGGALIWLHGTGRLWTRTPAGLGYRIRERARRRAGARGRGGRSGEPGAGGSRAAGVGPEAARGEWGHERRASGQGRSGRRARGGGAAYRDGGGRRGRTAAGDPRGRTGDPRGWTSDPRGWTSDPRGRTTVDDPAGSGPSTTEARRILGVDAGSDPDEVRRAYRRQVKRAHPDAPDGSPEAFKRVQAAYERLSDRA